MKTKSPTNFCSQDIFIGQDIFQLPNTVLTVTTVSQDQPAFIYLNSRHLLYFQRYFKVSNRHEMSS